MREDDAFRQAGGRALTVSAVLPCRNEVRCIERAILSLARQKEPSGGMEIIVVDGLSDDGTREVLARLATQEARLRVIDNPKKITPAGMNVGVRAARGKFIAIMGAHNHYAADYLYEAACLLESRPDVMNVGGVMIAEGNTPVQRAIASAFHHPLAAGGARWHDQTFEGATDTVFGGVYRREVFDRIGLFDESLVRNQDDELNLRLVRAGGLIWQSPRIRSWYEPRSSLRKLFLQYRQYGYWRVRVIRKHTTPASVRQLVPGAFVASLIGGGLLAAVGVGAGMVTGLSGVARLGRVPLLAVGAELSIYLSVVAGASVQIANRAGWNLLPILPAVFAVYHAAYGFGFLEGLLDWAAPRRQERADKAVLTR